MSTMTGLMSKNSNETLSLVFDFTSQVSASDTISSVGPSIVTYSGSDVNPGSVIQGSLINGFQVIVKVTGGVDGCMYLMTVTAVTGSGLSVTIQGYLAVNDTPN